MSSLGLGCILPCFPSRRFQQLEFIQESIYMLVPASLDVDALLDAILLPVPPGSNPSLAVLTAIRNSFALPPGSITSTLIALSVIFAL